MIKRYCVYMHISPEGLCYVGKTSRKPMLRWTTGDKYARNKDFSDAIKKHGEHDFLAVFEHFYLAEDRQTWLPWSRTLTYEQTNLFSSEEAEQLEKAWIGVLDTMKTEKGFNRASGGDSAFSLSSIAKDRNREAHLGRYDGENNPAYGMKHSEETKAFLSYLAKKRTGKKNPFYGHKHTEETKERNRQAHLGRYDGENNPFYGQKHTEESRKKMSEKRSLPVAQYDLQGNFIAEYSSQLIAAASVGVSVQALNSNCKGKTKTCAGFVFKYK